VRMVIRGHREVLTLWGGLHGRATQTGTHRPTIRIAIAPDVHLDIAAYRRERLHPRLLAGREGRPGGEDLEKEHRMPAYQGAAQATVGTSGVPGMLPKPAVLFGKGFDLLEEGGFLAVLLVGNVTHVSVRGWGSCGAGALWRIYDAELWILL
jgi:hypothetical protein